MPVRLAVNLSTVYAALPLLDAIAAAAADGFRAVEIQFPYAVPAEDLADALDRAGLPLVLINLPLGGPGEPPWPALAPAGDALFEAGLDRACRYAERLGVPRVNVLAGNPAPGTDRQQAFDRYVANLALARRRLADIGAEALVEPVNRNDRPRFLLHRLADALAAIDATGGGRRLQFDVYHMHQEEPDAQAAFRAHLDRIAHIQFADCPGRHEPGTGEIDFASWFRLIADSGYDGWCAAEYTPRAAVAEGLGWRAGIDRGGA